MSIWWSLHLRREAASVPLARRLLLGTMETAGVDPDISHDLSVALSEACANAVEHGGDAATEDYRVTAFINGDTCRIEVTDSGPGFRERTRRPKRPGRSGTPDTAAPPPPMA
ncbi:ATP-binding protein, partial [Streptomyces sp. WAC 06725]